MEEKTQIKLTNDKLPQHTINLILILIVSIFVLMNFALPSLTNYLVNLRAINFNASNLLLLEKLLPLRICLSFVFLWYSINNMQHPEVFNNISNILLMKFKIQKGKKDYIKLAYIQSVLELFTAITLLTGAYLDLGSLIGSILLALVLFAYEEGLGSLLVRDVGLLGGMVTILLFSLTGSN